MTALTQQKVMAADVNGDGEVNGNDLSELMYRATHIVRGFQQTNVQSDVSSWRFFPKSTIRNRLNPNHKNLFILNGYPFRSPIFNFCMVENQQITFRQLLRFQIIS